MAHHGTWGRRWTSRLLLWALVCSALMTGGQAQAMPEDGEVVAGTADIRQATPQRLEVLQGSEKAIIDWRAFSLGVDEQAHFQQPSASSLTLNRVRGGTASRVLGQLTANGQVLLINPNGILFGPSAVVDVGGLVATTLDIRDDDFLAGRFTFDGRGQPGATVVNRGRLTVAEGGLAALVAPGVENSGVIQARLGRVALASGHRFTLDLYGDSMVHLAVADRMVERLRAPDGAPLRARVTNRGTIRADGGTVVLAAGAARAVVDHVINTDGIIEARSAVEREGEIVLLGHGGGVVKVGGTLDVSGRARGETGGTITVLGEKIALAGQARLDASGDVGGGVVLVGGNFQGKGPERNAAYTLVGRGAAIQADALSHGDGGRVIVWSDRVTRFFGTISARGGAAAGAGGFAEVSGKEHLHFAPAAIDLGAAAGATGELLLDPQDIVISDSGGSDNSQVSSDNKVLFGDGTSTQTFNIQPSAFETINADVTLQAARDLTVSSPIDRSGAADSTLNLQAGRHLAINAAITGTNGAHSFIFEADSPRSGNNNNGTGKLTIGNVTISSNGGDITLIAAEFAIDTTTGSDINAGSGNIHVSPSQEVGMRLDTTTGNLSNAEIASFATSGTITFGRATTGPDAIGNAGSTVSASSITVDEALSIGGSASLVFNVDDTTTLNKGVTTADGDITFDDVVRLGAAVTIDSDSDNDAIDGDIEFTSTIDGGYALTLDADTGDVTLTGAVGGTTALSNLTITGSDVSLGAISLTGTLSLTPSGTTTLTGDIRTNDSAITFPGAVVLGGNVTIDSDGNNDNTDGAITFSSTINGGYALTLDADTAAVTLTGAVGGATKLGRLTVTGTGQVDVASVKTTGAIAVTGTNIDLNAGVYESDDGNISFTGPVDLTVATTIDSDKDNNATDGAISFSSTIDGGQALTLDADGGAVTLTGAVGGTTKLSRLTVAAGQVAVNSVKTTGGITITGTNIDLNAGVYESEDGTIKFDGPVALTMATTIDSDQDNDTTDGAIEFTSTIDGTYALTLDADTGDVTLTGAVGGTTTLSNLTITGSDVSLGAISLTGTLSLTPSGTTTLTGDIRTNDSAITFPGAVVLGGDVTIDSDGNDDNTAGAITFSSTINGGYALTLDADTAAVTLTGAVGGATKLGRLTVTGTGQVDVASVKTTGAIAVTGTNIDLNAGVYESDDGNISFTGPVDLTVATTIDSDKDNNATDGAISFSSTIDGGQALTLDADGGAVTLTGAVGGTTKLSRLTVASAGQVDVNAVKTTGGITITGTNIDLNAGVYESDDGTIKFDGPVDLTMTTSLDSDKNDDTTDGAIEFTSTIDGGYALTLDADTGDVTLTGAVGGTTTLSNLTITGSDVSLGAVSLTGTLSLTPSGTTTLNGDITTNDSAITFPGAVVLGADVTIDSDGNDDNTAGAITFSSTINGGQALTLDADDGAVTLTGAVGGATKLSSLTVASAGQVDVASVKTTGAIAVTGTNIDLNAGVYESDDGNISFTGPVALTVATTIDSDKDNNATDGAISFSSTIDGGQALTLDADGGAVTLTGAVGGTTKLSRLTVASAGQVDVNAVKTTGGITITGTNIDLNAGVYESDDGTIKFDGPVDLTMTTSLDSDKNDDTTDGAIEFTSTIDGGYALTLDADTGDVTLTGAVGGTTTLSNLTITGSDVSLGAVSLTGTLSLTPSGTTTLTGDITTDDSAITFPGAVVLGGDVTIDSDGNDDNTAGAITFSSTINGGYALTLDADTAAVTLTGAVGGTTKLGRLTVAAAGQVAVASVQTTGGIAITGTNIDLNAGVYESDDGNISFTGPVDLTVATTIDSDKNDNGTDGDISFSSTIDGGQALTLDADGGAVTLTGAVGGTTKLSRLTVAAGQVAVNSVKTTGGITITGTNIDLNAGVYESEDGTIKFDGPVALTMATTIDSDQDNDTTDGAIEFTSTIDGTYALTLDADTGDVTLTGAVGGTTNLTNLTITGSDVSLGAVSLTGTLSLTPSGTTTLTGDITTDDSAITFPGAVVLGGDVTIDSDGNDDNTAGAITFSSTINGGYALTLDADTAAVTLTGAVGGTTKLGRLTVAAAGQVAVASVQTTGGIAITGTNIDLNAGVYESDDGNISFTGPVDLTVATTIDSDKNDNGTDGDISFSSTIDGGQALTLDADGGAVTLTGAVGGTTKLSRLTVAAGQVAVNSVKTTGGITITGTNIDLNAGVYESEDGTIKFDGPVALTMATTIDSDQDNDTTDGAIEFTSTIDGTYALTLDADTGDVTLTGAVGGTTNLTNLTITGSDVSLGAVSLTGTLSLTPSGTTTLTGDITTDDSAITFPGAVVLGGNVTIDSDGNDDNTAGAITFSSTINGGYALTLDADTGDVTLTGAVGGTTKLGRLTVAAAGQVAVASVQTTGGIAITGTNIDLNAGVYESDDGNISFTGPVDLTVATTIDSDKNDNGTDGDISFSSTIDGGQALTLDADTGDVTLTGAVGGTTKLSRLTVAAGQVAVASVQTTGAIAVTGTNIDLNGSVYESEDGTIKFDGPVALTMATTIDSDQDNDTTDGAIEFTSTIDGTYALTLDADTGDVTLTGAVGGTTNLTNLTITGSDVSLGAVSLTGTLSLTPSGTTTLNGDITTDDSAITFPGAVVLGGNVTIDSDGNDDNTAGAITFSSTINGAKALTLDADTAAVTLTGAVGGTTKLGRLTVAAAGQVAVASVQTTGGIAITGTNIDLNAGVYESDDGNISFTGPVDLTVATTIDSDKNDNGTDGDISFSSTIDGGQALTLDADGGAVTLTGAVGGTTKLSRLTVAAAGQVAVASVQTTGAIAVTGTNIDLNGSVYESNDGNITFTGPVVLGSDVTIDSDKNDNGTDGAISFSSTINGGYALTLDADTGDVTLTGAVGGTTKLSRLTVAAAGQVAVASVQTTGAIAVTGTNIDLNGSVYESNDGNITFTGPVVLGSDVTIDSDKNDNGTDGAISFSSTINGAKALTLDADGGAVTLTGAVGGTTKLSRLTVAAAGQVAVASVQTTGAIAVTGTNIDLNGSVYESNDGNITFTGPVVLGSDVTIDSDKNDNGTDGAISFSSTINGGYALTLDADGGAVTLTGAVGGTTKLSRLTVAAAGQVAVASVQTTGAIAVTGTNIDLNGSVYESNDGNITFTGPVVLGSDVTIDSDKNDNGTDGAISFSSTINGAKALTLDADTGDVTLTGAVGGTTKLSRLTVAAAGQVAVASVQTTGAIAVTGTNIDLNGSVYESNDGNITFTGPVVLGSDVTIDSDKNDNGTDGAISFSSTINGAKALTLDADTGDVTLTGAVGGTTKLSRLTVAAAGQVAMASVQTTGAIAVTGTNIDLNGSVYESNDGNITFTGPVVLGSDVTIDSDKNDNGTDGAISFSSTINGGYALTLDADTGDVTLTGAVGGTTKLSRLTVAAAGQVAVASVQTTGAIAVTGTNIDLNGSVYESNDGNITFTGPVVLGSDVTIDSDKNDNGTDGAISFSSTINGAKALTLDADTGDVTLTGAVGGTTKLSRLTVAAAGQVAVASVQTTGAIAVTGTNIDLNGSVYESNDGNITFTGPVVLGSDVTIDSDKNDNGTDGAISFSSTINGAKALTLDADTGDVTLTGAVGGTTKLSRLTVAAAGQVAMASVQTTGAIAVTGTNIDLNGSVYESNDGNITFTGPVVLGSDVTIDSDKNDNGTDGAISFSSTINGGYALTLDADTGDVTLTGAVGGTTKLSRLTVAAAGQVAVASVQTTGAIAVTGTNIDLNAGVYESDDGNITFTGPVVLGSDVTIDSDKNDNGTDGAISFSSTINGAKALTLDADTGDVTLTGAVGGTTKLSRLTVAAAGQVAVASVQTTGAIAVTGTNIDLNGSVYESNDGNITFTGPVVLGSDVTIDSDKNDNGTDGTISFSSTINGGYALTLDADTGDVTLTGAVGGTTKLSRLTVAAAGQVAVASVQTTGAIAVTGTNIDLNGSVYESNDGNITFTGPVVLGSDVTIDSDKNDNGTDGAISFSSTINGGYALTLDADTGDVTLTGAVGGTTKLSRLTVAAAGQVAVASVQTTGAIAVTGTNIDLNGSVYESNDGNITFTGPVVLGSDVTIDSDKNDNGTDGAISFSSTINGGYALTLDADTGDVTLTGAVGGTTKLSRLTVAAAGQVAVASVQTTGAIAVTGTNIDLNGSVYESNDGNITFTGPVVLGSDVTIDSDKNDNGTDGAISFSSTINGGYALTLDADTGDVTLTGAVGGTTKLSRLTVAAAGQVAVASVQTTGAIAVTGTNIDLNGSVYESNDGNITFTGPVVLGSDVTIDSDKNDNGTDGAISFSSTINGGYALTLDADTGDVTLTGAVGGTTKLSRLTVAAAGQVAVASVQTTGAIAVTGTNIDLNGSVYESNDGNITFTGPVVLGSDVTIDSDKNDNGTDGAISFSSTINGAKALTLDADTGDVTLTGAVGGTTKLSRLTVAAAGQVAVASVQTTGAIAVTGTNIDLNGSVYESNDGNITFTGPVVLGSDVTIDSDKNDNGTDGAISFSSTINGGYALTLDADTGDVTLTGAVGGTTKLSRLTVAAAGQVAVASVQTTGAIAVTGTNIDLNGSVYESNDGNITFTGPVVLGSDVTIDSDKNDNGTDGAISFSSTINGGYALTLDADGGAVTLTGAVGGTTKLSRLTVAAAGQVAVASVQTTGAIAVTGTNIDLNGSVYESNDGNITFTGPVVLGSDVTIDSDKNDNGTDGAISFSSTINGAKALTLDADTGDVTLTGAVGGTTKLSRLTVAAAGQVAMASVQTTGAIAVTGTNIDLNGSVYESNDGNITFTGPVVLGSDVTIDSDKNDNGTDGAISFSSTINGGYALTLDADTGDVTLTGAVGGTTKLSRLTVAAAGQVAVASVQTTGAIAVTGTNIDLNGSVYESNDGNITFTGPVVLGSDVTIDSDKNDNGTDGAISFSSTINGGYALTLDADTGDVTLTGAVGGTTKLSRLTVAAAGQVAVASVQTTGAIAVTGTNIDLNGSVYESNDGNITFTGPVVLGSDVTIDSDKNDNGTDGAISFSSTINGAKALTLDADTGDVTLTGAVGGTTKLSRLTVAAAGQVAVASVQTTGAIAVTGTNIDLNGSVYESNDGNITFTGPVVLGSDVTIDSDKNDNGTDGAISFSSTINGAKALTLDADTGDVTLTGAVGGTTKLSRLTVAAAGQVAVASVQTTGAIAVTGTNIDLNGSVYESNDGNITFTGPVVLGSDVTIDSDKNDNGTDGAISFSSTINGGYALTLDADTGDVTLTGAVGGTTKLSRLTVAAAGQVAVASVQTTGAIAVTGTNIDLNGSVYESNDGNITFTGPVVLGSDVTIDSDKNDNGTDGAISFSSTINGAKALTLDADTGDVTLTGAVGGTTPLVSFTVTQAGAVSLQSVTTRGVIAVTGTGITLIGTYQSDDGHVTFTGPVVLAGDVTVDSDADEDNADGNITFSSTIDGAYNLTIDADTGFVLLGGTVNTASLEVIGTSGAQLKGNLISEGDITFNGPVILSGNFTLRMSSTNGSITFGSTINGSHNLVLEAKSGSVTVGQAVGNTTPLVSFTITQAGAVSLKSVTTTGAISVTGTRITLNGTYRSDDGDITFDGPVVLAGDVTVDSDAMTGPGPGARGVGPAATPGRAGDITFTSAITGGYTLTVDANTGTVSLKSVTTAGAIAVTGSRITLTGAYRSDAGDVTFAGPVVLAGDVRVDSDADRDQTDGDITFTSRITGGYALTVDADTGTVSLKSVTTAGAIAVTGSRITLTGAYRSDDGDVTFAGPVILAGAVLVDSDADRDRTDGDIRFTSTLDGGYALTLHADTGNIFFDGDVGATVKLPTVTITKAHHVTVATSMHVGSFDQLAGTGATDFGLHTVYADTVVNVTTRDIYGRIIAPAATLLASNVIGVTVDVDTLTIQAKSANIQGRVGGLGGGGAADGTRIRNRVPGSYKLNGFTILGTGRGTRPYAELTALPLPQPTQRWGTPGDAVFLQFSPILRASVVGAMEQAYPVNIFARPYPLLHPQAGLEAFYEQLPGVIRDMWWRLGPAAPGTPPAAEDSQAEADSQGEDDKKAAESL